MKRKRKNEKKKKEYNDAGKMKARTKIKNR